MPDTVANPESGASTEPQKTVEEQIAAAMATAEETPKPPSKKEDSKKSKEKDGDKPQPKTSDKKEDDSGKTDDSTDDSDDESEKEVDSDEDNSEEEESEELEFKTLEELAEAANMSVEDIKGMIKDKIKVQGKDIEVTYADLLKGQMLESDYRIKTSALAEDRKVFDGHKTEATQVIRAQVAQSMNVLKALQDEYLQVDEKTDWAELKRIDPHEFTLRRGELAERREKLGKFEAAVRQQVQGIQAKEDEKSKAEQGKYFAQQAENIKRLLPSWIDPTVASKESGEIRQWLKTSFDGDLGFSDKEIDGLSDARMVSIIRKAMELDGKMKKADHLKKKISNTPRMLKSKAKVETKPTKTTHKETTYKAKKSGDIRDAESAILGLL